MTMLMTRNHAKRVLLQAGASADDVARLLAEPPGLRDEFADHAMREQIRRTEPNSLYSQPTYLASYAYEVADAMMKKRSETK